jgi:hypothetical protein
VAECLERQLAAQRLRHHAPPGREGFEHARIVGGIDHHHHAAEVLGGGAQHGGAADVDHLHGVREGGAAGDRLLEGIEVDHHQVDALDAVRRQGVQMLGHLAVRQHAAVDLGMERLHPAVEDLGEAGDIRHGHHGDGLLLQGLQRAAGRDDLDPEAGQSTGQLVEAGLIEHGHQGAACGEHAVSLLGTLDAGRPHPRPLS